MLDPIKRAKSLINEFDKATASMDPDGGDMQAYDKTKGSYEADALELVREIAATTSLASHAASRGGMALRLSLDQLRELVGRASASRRSSASGRPTGNYMIVRSEDGTWIEIHPYIS